MVRHSKKGQEFQKIGDEMKMITTIIRKKLGIK